MKRNIQVLLLLFLGVGLLHISLLTDLYPRYVRPGLRPALIASGVLLIALGAVSAARDGFPFNRPRTDGDQSHDGEQSNGDGHGHSHAGGPKVAWLHGRREPRPGRHRRTASPRAQGPLPRHGDRPGRRLSHPPGPDTPRRDWTRPAGAGGTQPGPDVRGP